MPDLLARFVGWWSERHRRAHLRGARLLCQFGGLGCSQIVVGHFRPQRCGNCDEGRPRFVSGYELEQAAERRAADLRDGWLNEDGTYCDRDLAAKAVARGVTPADLRAEDGAS